MARTALTVQTIALAGIVPAYVAGDAVNHHEFLNDGKVFLHVKNGGGAPINVTVKAAVSHDGFTLTDKVVAVANGAEKMIGPFQSSTCNFSGGLVNVDLSAATSVTLAAFKLPV